MSVVVADRGTCGECELFCNDPALLGGMSGFEDGDETVPFWTGRCGLRGWLRSETTPACHQKEEPPCDEEGDGMVRLTIDGLRQAFDLLEDDGDLMARVNRRDGLDSRAIVTGFSVSVRDGLPELVIEVAETEGR